MGLYKKGHLYHITKQGMGHWELLGTPVYAYNVHTIDLFERLAENHPVQLSARVVKQRHEAYGTWLYKSTLGKYTQLSVPRTELGQYDIQEIPFSDLGLYIHWDSVYEGFERLLKEHA